MAVDLAADVEHGYLTEELGEVLLGEVVVFLYQTPPDFLFDLFLGFNVEEVGVLQAVQSFHLLLFLLDVFLQAFAD